MHKKLCSMTDYINRYYSRPILSLRCFVKIRIESLDLTLTSYKQLNLQTLFYSFILLRCFYVIFFLTLIINTKEEFNKWIIIISKSKYLCLAYWNESWTPYVYAHLTSLSTCKRQYYISKNSIGFKIINVLKARYKTMK